MVRVLKVAVIPVRSLGVLHSTPPGSTLGRYRNDADARPVARFTVRRDATSRCDGRVSDVLATHDSPMRTDLFLANPTAGATEPAALAEFARQTVRFGASIYDDPRDVLAQVDDLLAMDDPGVFMTALYGMVEQHDLAVAVSIANRGHALPIVVSAGSASHVGLHSAVLGSKAHRYFRGDLSRVTLERGDQLLLINDRPSDVPMPQPHRPDVVRNLPVGVSDHDLAEHVIEAYGTASVDVIVVSAGSACAEKNALLTQIGTCSTTKRPRG